MSSVENPNFSIDTQNFRVTEVCHVRDYLEEEAQRHRTTRRRYRRVVDAMTYTAVVSNAISACCGGAAVATLTAGITAPLSLVLAALSLGAGGIATVCTVTGKLLGKKLTKHERIENTARVSQDTVSAVVSKALIDQKISHDEYAAVLRQVDQYRQQKLEHRATLKYNDTDKVKNDEIRSQVQTEVKKLVERS